VINFDPEKARSNVPEELRNARVWLHWRAVPKEKGKANKIPAYVDGRPRGKTDTSEDRASLATFDRALQAFDPNRDAGVGVALGLIPDSSVVLCGIDLDNSVRARGDIGPAAQRVLAAAGNSYSEISPSGTGLKIFGLGDIGTVKTAELEIYSGGRFFTVTGERIQGAQLADLAPAAAMCRELLAAKARSQTGPRIEAGERNNSLFSEACRLRARNVSEQDALEALRTLNQRCEPPLDEDEVRQVLAGAFKYPAGFALTDLGNGERFADTHSRDARFVDQRGWATWAGHRWDFDGAKSRVMLLQANVVRSLYAQAAHESDDEQRKRVVSHARASESRQKLEAAVALAAWQPEIADSIVKFDANPSLVGVRNGVYDLEKDEFRAGHPDDRISLCADVDFDPAAVCPRWQKFQEEIHPNDAELVRFKKRAWGYTLSGDTSEQVIFLCYGEGANGKTTEQNAIFATLGSYAKKVQPETLLTRDRGGANNDIARIRGARFVATVELEDGGRIAESLIKQLTGSDVMTARFLYNEFFEFRPTAKIWLATNHKPEVAGTDHAIWRRIVLVPYDARFNAQSRDKSLEAQLLAERSGILNWLIAGYREWRDVGLSPPSTILAATASYRDEMDRIGNFLRECCIHGPSVRGRTAAAQLYREYKGWTEGNSQRPLSAKKFHERMERDHQQRRVDGNRGRLADYPNLVLISSRYPDADM